MKKIGIVLINYGEKSLNNTLECLNSLKNIELGNFEYKSFVLCYGDEKTEDLAIEIKSKHSEVEIIIESGNLGFAKGNNIGIKKALEWGADYVLLLNNDTIVHPGFLMNLYNYLEENDKVCAVSPKIYFEKGFEFHKDKYEEKDLGNVIWYAGGVIDWANIYASHKGVDEVDQGQFDEIYDPEFISGCCVLIRKEIFEKVGYLNEDLFLYWEDTELSMRIKDAGYEIKYYPKAHIWHKNAGGSGVGSDLHDYFLNRNRLWFGFKYGETRTKRALFKHSIKLWLSGNKWVKRAVSDYYFGKMGVGSWK